MTDPSNGRETASRGVALEVLEELEGRIARVLPEWTERGPEDPARVILEAFADSVGELRAAVESLPDKLLVRLLAELGEEARWPIPARAAVILVPRADLGKAVKVPAGTGVTSSRHACEWTENSDGWSRASFETATDAWLSPARLRLAQVLEDERLVELPVLYDVPRPEGSVESGGVGVTLFSRRVLDRHIYLGDAAWETLQRASAEVILEWSGAPAFVVQGRWEYSVHGGWRLLPVDFEERLDSAGKRMVRMRVFGPLPDLAFHRLQGTRCPWLRLALDGGRRVQWTPPTLAWVPPSPSGAAEPGPSSDSGGEGRDGSPAGEASRESPGAEPPSAEEATPAGDHRRPESQNGPPAFVGNAVTPRSIARVFSNGGDRWEDHSFHTTRTVSAARPAESWYPAVYFGWDRPLPASLYVSVSGGPPNAGPDAPGLEWEYSTDGGFRSFEPTDGTLAFSRPGTIAWGLLDGWAADELFGARLFWIRARWVEGGYSEAPVLEGIYPGAVEVIEGRTLRNQVFDLDFGEGARAATFPGAGEGEWAPFRDLELEVVGEGWRRFEVTEEDGELREDQTRLRRSPRGEIALELGCELRGVVRVRIPELRVGLGASRSAANGALSVLESDVEGLVDVKQAAPSREGLPGERLEDVCRRVRAEWRSGFRAVTVADFRRLLRAVDPGLRRVEVVPCVERPSELFVVVFPPPPCEPGRLSPARLERLRRYLEDKVLLGTVVRVVEPCYLPYDLEFRCEEWTDVEKASAPLEEELRAFLHPLSGGEEGSGYPLGRGLRRSDLESIISRFCEERSVGKIELTAIHACGSESRERDAEEGPARFCLTSPVLGRLNFQTGGP